MWELELPGGPEAPVLEPAAISRPATRMADGENLRGRGTIGTSFESGDRAWTAGRARAARSPPRAGTGLRKPSGTDGEFRSVANVPPFGFAVNPNLRARRYTLRHDRSRLVRDPVVRLLRHAHRLGERHPLGPRPASVPPRAERAGRDSLECLRRAGVGRGGGALPAVFGRVAGGGGGAGTAFR